MSAKNLMLRRGEIVRVRLDPVEGHEQAGVRPALVLSPDLINEHFDVVMVAAITSKRLAVDLPFEVVLASGEGGLRSDSKVMLMQVRSIDKRQIVSRFGELSEAAMKRVDRALAIATGLLKI